LKTFKLNCHVTVSAYTEVQAGSLDDAIKIAAARDVVIGGIGTGNEPDESWIIEDADGAPQNIYHDEDDQ
jgi:hypothetical protein